MHMLTDKVNQLVSILNWCGNSDSPWPEVTSLLLGQVFTSLKTFKIKGFCWEVNFRPVGAIYPKDDHLLLWLSHNIYCKAGQIMLSRKVKLFAVKK